MHDSRHASMLVPVREFDEIDVPAIAPHSCDSAPSQHARMQGWRGFGALAHGGGAAASALRSLLPCRPHATTGRWHRPMQPSAAHTGHRMSSGVSTGAWDPGRSHTGLLPPARQVVSRESSESRGVFGGVTSITVTTEAAPRTSPRRVADMNIDVPVSDARCIDVVARGLPSGTNRSSRSMPQSPARSREPASRSRAPTPALARPSAANGAKLTASSFLGSRQAGALELKLPPSSGTWRDTVRPASHGSGPLHVQDEAMVRHPRCPRHARLPARW